MCEQTRELDTVAGIEDKRGFDHLSIIRSKPRTMIAGIDLDHDLDRIVTFRCESDEVAGHTRARNKHLQIEATVHQVGDVPELVRGYADRVRQVGEAVVEEVLGFAKRRHRPWPDLTPVCDSGDLARLGRLQMRPQTHVMRAQVIAHAPRIALDPLSISDQGRCFEVSELHECRAPVRVQRLLRPVLRSPPHR